MRINKTLGAIVLAAESALLGGCLSMGQSADKPKEIKSKYVYGTVLKESGTIVERSRGSFFGDKLELYKPTYAIQFLADDGGTYTVGVINQNPNEKYARLEALNLAIDEGTRIMMYKHDFENLHGNVGVVDDRYLGILEQK